MTSNTSCVKCMIDKPPRAHHWDICKKWVPRLDHHWYFLGKWIGYLNTKHFILFCFYNLLDKLFTCLYLLHFFKALMFHSIGPAQLLGSYLLLGCLSLVAFVICAVIGCQTLFNACFNTTYREFRYFNFNNPLRHDSMITNLKEVFGHEDNPIK